MSGLLKFAGLLFVFVVIMSTPVLRELIAIGLALYAAGCLVYFAAMLAWGLLALIAAPFVFAGGFIASLFDRS